MANFLHDVTDGHEAICNTSNVYIMITHVDNVRWNTILKFDILVYETLITLNSRALIIN